MNENRGTESTASEIGRLQIEAAHERIAPYIRTTPTLWVEATPFQHDTAVCLKLENLQHGGSFKVRGAFNNLLVRDLPARHVAAASGGNHGVAVAYAANRLDFRADIFVPEIADPAKVGRIRDLGAVLHVGGRKYADALAACDGFRAVSQAADIHAYAAAQTVAGQGTLALEWERQAPDLDTLLIAVGGAGLISGAATWHQGQTRIVGVEPEGSCALHAALSAGQPVEVTVDSIAADSLGATSVGPLNHDICAKFVEQVVQVSDDAIRQALAHLWTQYRIAAEPGAAAALAALLGGQYQPALGERVGVLICGGNIALSSLIAHIDAGSLPTNQDPAKPVDTIK